MGIYSFRQRDNSVSCCRITLSLYSDPITSFFITSFLTSFTPAQLEYFYGFPPWAYAAWAIGVWGSMLGAIGLLLRKTWAVWAFGAALLGLAVSSFYNFVLTDGMAVMGGGGAIFTGVIWIIALLLFFYARAVTRGRR